MKKLSILRQKLIKETKHLIDEDEIQIGDFEEDIQSVQGDMHKKENLGTLTSERSNLQLGDTKSLQQQLKGSKSIISNGVLIKQREGEDNLLSLQKNKLRKPKISGQVNPVIEKNSTQSQINLHNTLMDIQQEYLNYEMKRAQNEYAIDLDLIQEDFANQLQQNEPQLDLQKKKKSQFMDLLKKCKIISESDLHYASKPFKLVKKLKDIRIMFERKSNNLEQQMKKNNMNKNKIIEDIKADKVIIRKALPEMAKNYLSEIQQQKRMNKLLQEKKQQKAQKQQSAILLNQTGSITFNNNYFDKSSLRLPLSKLGSQEPTTIIDHSCEIKGNQTYRTDLRYKSTSPFRKHNSNNLIQEAKTSRHAPLSDYSSFNDINSNHIFNEKQTSAQQIRKNGSMISQNGQINDKNLIPISYISEYGSCFSQDNSPYIRPFDSQIRSPIYQISQFNSSIKNPELSNNQQQIAKQSQGNTNQNGLYLTPNNQDSLTVSTLHPNISHFQANSTKPSFNSFSSLHLQSTNDLKGQGIKNQQIDYHSINSLQNLSNNFQEQPRQSQIGSYHRHSKSELGSNSQISIEKLQYLFYLQNQQEKQQSNHRMSFTTFNNKSNTSLSTTTKTNLHGLNTDRNSSLKNDYILIRSPSMKTSTHLRSNSYLQNGNSDNLPLKSPINNYNNNNNNFGNQTERISSNSTKQIRIISKNHFQTPKKKKDKEGILENVYKFDEDQYFKHQQIYKFEQEQAQIQTIKRNQNIGQQKPQTESQRNKKQKVHKKNESYFHDEYSSNDDSIPSATEAQLDNYYEESRKIQNKVLKLQKGDIQTKIKSLLRMENINNEINKLVQWKMKK